MTATLPAGVMVGMLRKGQTGNQILEILNTLVPNQTELTPDEVVEDMNVVDEVDEVDEVVGDMNVVDEVVVF
jgi:hypothetical protein